MGSPIFAEQRRPISSCLQKIGNFFAAPNFWEVGDSAASVENIACRDTCGTCLKLDKVAMSIVTSSPRDLTMSRIWVCQCDTARASKRVYPATSGTSRTSPSNGDPFHQIAAEAIEATDTNDTATTRLR